MICSRTYKKPSASTRAMYTLRASRMAVGLPASLPAMWQSEDKLRLLWLLEGTSMMPTRLKVWGLAPLLSGTQDIFTWSSMGCLIRRRLSMAMGDSGCLAIRPSSMNWLWSMLLGAVTGWQTLFIIIVRMTMVLAGQALLAMMAIPETLHSAKYEFNANRYIFNCFAEDHSSKSSATGTSTSVGSTPTSTNGMVLITTKARRFHTPFFSHALYLLFQLLLVIWSGSRFHGISVELLFIPPEKWWPSDYPPGASAF